MIQYARREMQFDKYRVEVPGMYIQVYESVESICESAYLYVCCAMWNLRSGVNERSRDVRFVGGLIYYVGFAVVGVAFGMRKNAEISGV